LPSLLSDLFFGLFFPKKPFPPSAPMCRSPWFSFSKQNKRYGRDNAGSFRSRVSPSFFGTSFFFLATAEVLHPPLSIFLILPLFSLSLGGPFHKPSSFDPKFRSFPTLHRGSFVVCHSPLNVRRASQKPFLPPFLPMDLCNAQAKPFLRFLRDGKMILDPSSGEAHFLSPPTSFCQRACSSSFPMREINLFLRG